MSCRHRQPSAPVTPGHPESWLMVGAVVAVILLGILQGCPTALESVTLVLGVR